MNRFVSFTLPCCFRGNFPGLFEVISVPQKDWRLTQEAFDRFLAELDPDRDGAGRKYEALRSKLIKYFDWRDCPFPEDHADEALNRVVRKVWAGEEIRDVSIYVFGIARMLLWEIARASEKERATLTMQSAADLLETESDETQLRINGLRQCLAALSEDNRQLITQYYEGDGPRKIIQRKDIALRLGLPLNALRIRAYRVREKLEKCMQRYVNSDRI